MMYIPFFKDVDKTLLQSVEMTRSKYAKGMTIYMQGTVCNSMDIVFSGSLVAYALSPNGSESRVFTFEKNSVIGANLLFGNANRYPLNIYATTDCELLRIKSEAISELLHDYQFTMNFIKSLSLNSQGMNQKIAMYTQKTLRENLMDYLTALSAQQQSNTIRLPMSKKQLADYFGVQRPSLFRELKRMQNEGLVVISNKEIQLTNRQSK